MLAHFADRVITVDVTPPSDRQALRDIYRWLEPDIAARICQVWVPDNAAKRLLAPLGRVIELGDEQMDAATAVMGCSPAYFAAAAAAITGVGVSDGLHADVAASMVADALAGTAALLGHRTPFEIQVAVASPGGSTEAGLEALEAAGGAEAFREAGEASLRRMRGKQ